jgi:glycosyltransferase involved in cell wall biosynthesis
MYDIDVIHLPHERRRIRDSKLRTIRLPSIPSSGLAQFYACNFLIVGLGILRHIIRSRPDVIISSNPILGAILGFTKRIHQTPIIFDLSDDYPAFVGEYVPPLIEPILRAITRILLDSQLGDSTKIIATSSDLAEYAKRITKEDPLYVPNGAFAGRFRRRSVCKIAQRVVGYLGGLFGWSGVYDLVRAFNHVTSSYSESELHIYGYGPSSKRIREMSEKREGVKFFGEIPFEQVPSALSTFDVAVIPFVRTHMTDAACPMKLFEYWASGTPVISRNLKETSRLAGGAALFFDDVERHSVLIIQCFNSGELRQRLSAK